MAKKKTPKRAEPMIPESLNTPEFTTAWAEWLKFAQDSGKPMADDDAARQLKLLAKLGSEKAIADIRKTMQDLASRVPDQATETEDAASATPAKVAKKGGKKAETPTNGAVANDGPVDSPPAKPAKKAKAPKEPKAKKMSALDAAAKVLADKGEPMNCQEMIDAMAAAGFWKSPGGLTPAATLYSAILRETNKKGSDARFVKTERGKFVRA